VSGVATDRKFAVALDCQFNGSVVQRSVGQATCGTLSAVL
jgi:hypothetical protein